eukprot:scaffold2625_cov30-Tisochrysis_lutea.AAC.2
MPLPSARPPLQMSAGRGALCISLAALFALALWHRSPTAAIAPAREVQIEWSGRAAAVAVVGEWDRWASSRSLSPTLGDRFTASLRLPTECPDDLLVSRQVCCYRYAFRLGRTAGEAAVAKLQVDPRQPTDLDREGRPTNIICVSADKSRAEMAVGTHAGGISRTAGAAIGELVPSLGNSSSVALARANGKPLPCVQLASSRWGAVGTPADVLHRIRAPTWAHCCDECLRQERCAGFNWRTRGAKDSCELLPQASLGTLLTTLSATAGVIRNAVAATVGTPGRFSRLR